MSVQVVFSTLQEIKRGLPAVVVDVIQRSKGNCLTYTVLLEIKRQNEYE